MGEQINKIEKALVLILVFLFPTQLALHFWPSWSFVFGIRIDYLAPTIYLTDLLASVILVLGFIHNIKSTKTLVVKNKYLLLSFLVLIILNCLFSVSVLPTVYKWFKFLEFGLLGIYFAYSLKQPDWKRIYQTLFISLMFFSLIGIDQFLIGHTVGGVLYWLGERNFTTSTPGIALVNITGQNFLRVYSTFPHPNALAGYFGVSFILLFLVDLFNGDRKNLLGLVLICICFLLTFSLSALVGVAVVLFLVSLRKKVKVLKKVTILIFVLIISGSLLMPIVSDGIVSNAHFNKNISERFNLATVSGKIITQYFWFGSGLNTFTVAMTKVRPTTVSSWLLQPVHNIFLLSLSEVGIFGLLLLTLYLNKLSKVFPLIFIFIIITGFFDHYWLDGQQNLLLLSLISGHVFKPKK